MKGDYRSLYFYEQNLYIKMRKRNYTLLDTSAIDVWTASLLLRTSVLNLSRYKFVVIVRRITQQKIFMLS